MRIMTGKTIRTAVLLAGAMLMGLAAGAQQRTSVDLGLTAGLEHSQVAATGAPGFWLKGGAVDGAVSFYKGLGVAAEFGGSHARINPGVTLSEFVFQGGPRYTMATPRKQATVFMEALFGMAHGFDSLFPAGNSTVPTANAFHMQIGGGVNWQLQHGFGVRPLEIDFVHSSLSNNAGNSQNDFRLAFGITYHFGRK